MIFGFHLFTLIFSVGLNDIGTGVTTVVEIVRSVFDCIVVVVVVLSFLLLKIKFVKIKCMK